MKEKNKKLETQKEESDQLVRQVNHIHQKQTQQQKQQSDSSPNKRVSKDLSNAPNGDRRSSYLENGNVQQMLEQIQEKIKQEEEQESKKKATSNNLAIFLNCRIADIIIIILVILYTCLVFINFAFTNDDVENNQDIAQLLYIVLIIELVILFIFMIEILLKSYAFGIKNYFQDYWLIFDAVVIVISVIMIFLDWSINDSNFTTVSRVLRGIFRFLRLFLVFRKFNTVKKISQSNTRYNVRAPIEKILEILNNLTTEFEDQDIVKELKWCIEKISSNKLYEPLIEEMGKNQKDIIQAKNWIESMGQTKKEVNKVKEVELENEQKMTEDEQARKISKLNIPQSVIDSLNSDLCNLEFDYFGLYKEHNHLILPYLVCHIFDHYNLFQQLRMDPKNVYNLAENIAKGYHADNPYHNVIHAFDVTQTVNFFMESAQFNQIANLKPLDQTILIIGAAVHDYDHPGFNNPFQINMKTDLAIKYNGILSSYYIPYLDKSPLENYHASSLFFMLNDPDKDIRTNLKLDDKKYFRERIISMILGTDMAQHFADLGKLKGRLASGEFDPSDKDKGLCMDSLLHAADISNPFKPFNVYRQWTNRVLAEFWIQGDKEREEGFTISYLCDRFTTNTAKSQLGFIDFVVAPYYDSIKQFLPILDEHVSRFEENKDIWKESIDEYEETLKILNEDHPDKKFKVKVN